MLVGEQKHYKLGEEVYFVRTFDDCEFWNKGVVVKLAEKPKYFEAMENPYAYAVRFDKDESVVLALNLISKKDGDLILENSK